MISWTTSREAFRSVWPPSFQVRHGPFQDGLWRLGMVLATGETYLTEAGLAIVAGWRAWGLIWPWYAAGYSGPAYMTLKSWMPLWLWGALFLSVCIGQAVALASGRTSWRRWAALWAAGAWLMWIYGLHRDTPGSLFAPYPMLMAACLMIAARSLSMSEQELWRHFRPQRGAS